MDVGELARRELQALLVDDGIAARGLADSAVCERFCAGHRADRRARDYKRQPRADRTPRVAGAPATDRRERDPGLHRLVNLLASPQPERVGTRLRWRTCTGAPATDPSGGDALVHGANGLRRGRRCAAGQRESLRVQPAGRTTGSSCPRTRPSVVLRGARWRRVSTPGHGLPSSIIVEWIRFLTLARWRTRSRQLCQ